MESAKREKTQLRKVIEVLIFMALCYMCVQAFKFYKDYKMLLAGAYSIARVTKVGYGDSVTCHYKFTYFGEIITSSIEVPSSFWGDLYHPKEGNRYLVKFAKNELWISELMFEYPIPHCVYQAPSKGWENIPDISKMCD